MQCCRNDSNHHGFHGRDLELAILECRTLPMSGTTIIVLSERDPILLFLPWNRDGHKYCVKSLGGFTKIEEVSVHIAGIK